MFNDITINKDLVRVYLTAHAPTAVPGWFKPTMRERPTASNTDRPEQYRTAVQEWETEYEREKFLQWPVAWAEAMIEQLRKAQSK